MLCRPLSQINLTMQPGPASEGRLGCVLAVWGWGERRMLPSACPPPLRPLPSARTPELKARALHFAGLVFRCMSMLNRPPERFAKPELE